MGGAAPHDIDFNMSAFLRLAAWEFVGHNGPKRKIDGPFRSKLLFSQSVAFSNVALLDKGRASCRPDDSMAAIDMKSFWGRIWWSGGKTVFCVFCIRKQW